MFYTTYMNMRVDNKMQVDSIYMINSLLQAVPRRVAVHQRLDRWLPMSLLLHIRGSFAKHTRYSTSYASSNRRFYTKRKMNHKVARYIIHYIGTTLAAVTDDFFTFAHMRHYVNRTETALGARTCTGAPIHVVCRSSTRQNPYSHVSSLHIFALRYRCAHVYTEKGCWIQGAVHTPHHDHMATDTYDNTSLRLAQGSLQRADYAVGRNTADTARDLLVLACTKRYYTSSLHGTYRGDPDTTGVQ